MLFSTIQGYTNLKQTLRHSVSSGTVPHALLLAGPEGTAALHLALALATYLHCPHKTSQDACGHCPSCQKIARHVHPDVHYIFPIGGGGKQAKETARTTYLPYWRTFMEEHPYGSAADWCDAISADARVLQIGKAQVAAMQAVMAKRPFESHCKTILIWLPETLHPVAGNALLKMVEEPVAHTYFLFVSFAPNRLLTTLHSRLCPLHLMLLEDQEMYELLCATYPKHDQAQLQAIVRIAQGNLNTAHKLAHGSPQYPFDHVAGWLRVLYKKQFSKLMGFVETFHEYTAQQRQHWVAYTLELLRHALLMPFDGQNTHGLGDDAQTFCHRFSQVVQPQRLMVIIHQLVSLAKVLTRHANARLAFAHASFSISKALAA